MIRSLITISLLVLIAVCSFAHIKVACVGDSITYGFTISGREQNSYPAQLEKILDSGWEVKNFGVVGATLLKNGDLPYMSQKEMNDALEYNPDVVIIMLGTNDSKVQNLKYKKEFIVNYVEMIKEFKALPSKPDVFICLPVPAYTKTMGIRDRNIRMDIIPMIKSVGWKNNVEVINLYDPLNYHGEWYTDKIHPDITGAGVIAKTVGKVLVKNKSKFEKRK
jgi:lysophospholipase L1-like esterase